MDESPSAERAAERFEEAFRAVFARFHRRDGVARGLSNSSRAVLTHLAAAGPMTIGEASRHLDRSQSTTSEILSQLERHGLVERRSDETDARRTLVWLSEPGFEALRREDRVLSLELLGTAFERLEPGRRGEILAALEDLNERTEK